MTVADEIADAVILIDSVHIVISLRVEWHAQILWFQETAGVRIVTGEEDVVASDALFTLAGEVEGDAIGEHERVGSLVDTIADTLKSHRPTPFTAQLIDSIELLAQAVIGQTEIGFVAHLVDEDAGAVVLTLIEKLPGTHDRS